MSEITKKRGRPKKEVVTFVPGEAVNLEVYTMDQKRAAIKELWKEGVLHWKLKGIQRDMYDSFHNSTNSKTIYLVSRRSGKTFTSLIIAIEICLKNPNVIIKYLCPKLKDAKTIIRPAMRDILEDCPSDCLPGEGDLWKEADKMYQFPNGSQIQIAGTDNGNAESVRGGKAHLVICDEAGFMDDFTYIVRAILSPTLKTTRGKMLIVSTPSRFPTHPFMTDFVHPAEAEGSLVKYTIYNNPMFTPEDIQSTINEYPLGSDDPEFLREYMCISQMDSELAVINNFTTEVEEKTIKDVPLSRMKDYYVSADIGFRDLTAVLFGYWDYVGAKLVILDELIINGPQLTTDYLAEKIREKEAVVFKDPLTNEPSEPFLRVMDNDNLILWNDLNKLHGIKFNTTKKDNRDAQINHLKMMLAQGRVNISPKCKHLIYHIKNAKWNKKRSDFDRLNDTPNKLIKGGHADALAAAIYLLRNINQNRNTFSASDFDKHDENLFQSLHVTPGSNKTKDLMHTIYNYKKSQNKTRRK